MSYGAFSKHITPKYRYGIPFNITLGDEVIDIDTVPHTQVESNKDKEKITTYSLSKEQKHSLNDEQEYNKGLKDLCPSERVKLYSNASF